MLFTNILMGMTFLALWERLLIILEFLMKKIAGSYIQRFSILGVFSIPLILKLKNSKTNYYIFLFLIISIIGIIFSGNRMPIINIFLFFLLPIFFLKELKKSFSNNYNFKFVNFYFIFKK